MVEQEQKNMSANDLLPLLKGKTLVVVTHSFDPDMQVWIFDTPELATAFVKASVDEEFRLQIKESERIEGVTLRRKVDEVTAVLSTLGPCDSEWATTQWSITQNVYIKGYCNHISNT